MMKIKQYFLTQLLIMNENHWMRRQEGECFHYLNQFFCSFIAYSGGIFCHCSFGGVEYREERVGAREGKTTNSIRKIWKTNLLLVKFVFIRAPLIDRHSKQATFKLFRITYMINIHRHQRMEVWRRKKRRKESDILLCLRETFREEAEIITWNGVKLRLI